MKKHLKELFQKINSNITLKNVLINIVVLLLCVCLFPVFEENDDVGMEHIVSGFYVNPDSHMVFINILIGKILSLLYTVVPAIKWYVIFTYLVIFASLLVFSNVIDNRGKNSIYAVGLKYIFLIIFGYEMYCNIQFTKTAGLAALAGFMLLADFIERQIESDEKNIRISRKTICTYILSIALVLTGCMIRHSAFWLTLPFAAIIYGRLFIKLWGLKVEKSEYLKFFGSLAIMGIIILGAYYGNKAIYKLDDNWSYFKSWNSARSKVSDYNMPDYFEEQDKYVELGMTENDYYMLRNWAFGDTDFFSLEKMAELKKMAKSSGEFSFDDIKRIITVSIPDRFGEIAFRGYLCLLLIFVLTSKNSILDKLLLWGSVMGVFVIFSYFDCKGRTLNRMNVVLWLSSIAVMFLLYRPGETGLEKVNMVKAACVVIIVAVVLNSGYFVSRKKDEKRIVNQRCEYQERTLKIAEDSETTYINDLSQNMFETAWSGVFDRLPGGVRFTNVIDMGGWLVCSPLWKLQMYENGISNLFADTTDKNFIYIATDDRAGHINTYINEHYNPYARLIKVKEFEDGIGFYKSVTSPVSNMLDVSEYSISDDLSDVFHYASVFDDGEKYTINGTVFKNGESSYWQKVYVIDGDLNSDDVKVFETCQIESASRDDEFEGKYGNFTLQVDKSIVDSENELRVVLVSGDNLYCIPMDSE